jgi:hypothetical protein
MIRVRGRSCPRCGHPVGVLSRRRPLLPLRLLGLKYFRCSACDRRFLAWHTRRTAS